MGSELQSKYQRLAQEYAKLRSHVEILKKAVKEEKSQRESLQENVREKALALRKHVQENESLEFRNQQLSKRVEMLQDDLGSPVSRRKKKTGGVDGVVGGVSEVQTQELAAKISENAQLHLRIAELTQKTDKTASALQSTRAKLESEVASHTEALEQKEGEHKNKLEAMTSERAMLEAKLAKHGSELSSLKKTLQREQELSSRLQESSPLSVVSVDRRSDTVFPAHYTALNVPVVDAKLQGRVLGCLRACLELLTAFATQLSTLHSYLQQRCKTYPIDTATGSQISVVNKKLSKLLLSSSSSYTKPLTSSLSQYHDKLHANPYTQTSSSDLAEFVSAHHRLVAYLDTLTPYLQLSLQEESSESVCGAQLTDTNMQLSNSLPRLVAAFSTTDSYLNLLARGPAQGVPVSSLPVCLEKMKLSFRDVHSVLEALHNLYSTKITLEYQLPSSSQKLNTTNECIVSAFSGLTLTALQMCELLEEHSEVFSMALALSTPDSTEVKSSTSTVVQRLRQRATDYIRLLKKECPESVPYTLALYNARCMSSSSENRETLSKQVTSSQERISRLEQEKEQLVLDLQLLNIKYEKEQRKVEALEAELSQHSAGNTLSLPQYHLQSLNTSRSSLASNPQLQSLSGSVGSLSAQGEEPSDEAVREELIRKHFTNRISELNAKMQEVDSKAAHYYAENRAVVKQLNHNTATRSKLSQDLDTARETIQHLQDQLTTTSSNYERQLSTMSDHLCELNDKMMQQTEDLELLRKNKGKRWGK